MQRHDKLLFRANHVIYGTCITHILEPLETGGVILRQGPPREVLVGYRKAEVSKLKKRRRGQTIERERAALRVPNTNATLADVSTDGGTVGSWARSQH